MVLNFWNQKDPISKLSQVKISIGFKIIRKSSLVKQIIADGGNYTSYWDENFPIFAG
jgi:hypothetical protein